MKETTQVRKCIDVETKDLGERKMEFHASGEGVDRDGDIIRADGWDTKNWRKNPVFLWSHARSMPPLARGLSDSIADKSLDIAVEFAQKGVDYEDWPTVIPSPETVYLMYKGGFMRAVSVGFMPEKYAVPESPEERQNLGLGRWGVEYLKQELLELSAVTVPANPNALRLALSSGLIEQSQAEVWEKLIDNPHRELLEKCADELVDIFIDKATEVVKFIEEEDDNEDTKTRSFVVPPAQRVTAANTISRSEIEELVFSAVERGIAGLTGAPREGSTPSTAKANAEDDIAGFKTLWGVIDVSKLTRDEGD
jgi:hypothetical protein